MSKKLTAKATLIVFGTDGRTVGEYVFSYPYGDDRARLLPLKNLKREYVGAIMGKYGIVAISAELPHDNPLWREDAEKIERIA